MPQQEGQRQHSKNSLQLSTGLPTDSTTSEVSSIRNLGTWEPEEPQGDRHLESIEVQQKPNSQPSQNTFINSRPMLERKTEYHYNGKHDEGRPADSLPSQDWSTISAASSGPQTRSKHTVPTASPGQQFSWSRTGTEASSASNKPPRQNSHSTDHSKYPLPKRHISRYESHALRHTSPAFVHPAQIAAGLSLEASVDATQGVQRRTRDIPSSPSHGDPDSSSAQRDETAGSLASRTVLPKDFEGASETCISWLLSPAQFSSTEWLTCRYRKQGISHLITHIADHHGLIRGHDPQYSTRKYTGSCQSSNPFMKAKGDCVKCSSLSEWNDTDFADLTHHGVVLCLRCWRKFNKKEMKEHLAGPLCDYKVQQPKAKKLWILYTAFCSETPLPSEPPKYMAPRKSLHRTIRQRRQQFGQDRMAASVDNLDTTIFPPDAKPLLPRFTPGSSLVPSTAGESVKLLHSPKLDASMRLWDEANDLNVDMSRWDFIGSYPDLQTTTNAADPVPLQPTDRHQELEPKGRISPLLRAALEKDSGYRSADGKDM